MDQRTIVAMAAADDPDLAGRLDFLLEIDKLKSVMRRSRLVDNSRYENTAEHSWHLAMAVLVLAPHAGEGVDIGRAIEILLVHDLVEIDAGDTYIYDDDGRLDKHEREQAAAQRIFNLLPDDQAAHIADLWGEYETRATPTARFAYAIDRLQPVLLNAGSDGASWRTHGIRHSQAAAVNAPIVDGSPALWRLVEAILDRCAAEGALGDDRAGARAGTA